MGYRLPVESLILISTLFAVPAANAEIVQVEFSGATLEGSVGGDIDYAPGETFSGRFVFDTSVSSDIATDPSVGSFRDSTNFLTVSGMNVFEFSTSEGDSIVFDRDLVSIQLSDSISTFTSVLQIQSVGSTATVSSQNLGILDFQAVFPGTTPIISGDVKGLQPNSVSLQLQSSTQGGDSRILFDDPNALLSGDSRSFELDDTTIGDEYAIGLLTIAFTDGQDTSLVVGDITYTVMSTADVDGDSVADNVDNCTLVSNANQFDADNDGFGNVCDTDVNNDCLVNFLDISSFSGVFNTANELHDFNNDGSVNFLDYVLLTSSFGGQPGPSGQSSCP